MIIAETDLDKIPECCEVCPTMMCPVCGSELRPNQGWAAQFYDGYCNICDMPVEDGVPEEGEDETSVS